MPYSTQNRLIEPASSPDISVAEPSLLNVESSALSQDWSYGTEELLDALPRAWSRLLLYVVIGGTSILVPWAAFAKIDEVGTARGRLEPSSKTLRLDAPIAGTVSAVKVKEGQTVKAGQVLLEFESQTARSDLQQAQAKLDGLNNRLGQLNLMRSQLVIALRTQEQQSQAQQAEQLAQMNQVQQSLNANQVQVQIEKARLAVADKNVQRHQYLVEQGALSTSKLEEVQSAQLERQQTLAQAQAGIDQTQTELEKQQKAYDRVVNTGKLATIEMQRQLEDLEGQKTSLLAEILQTQKLIQSLQFQLQQRVLRAPADGTVYQLAVQNAGAVLQPGQGITQIAPKGVPLILRAEMPNRDSGFLKKGMPVKLKFDAYPYQDYGVVQGKVQWVSPDSRVQDTAQGKAESYQLEIAVPKTQIATDQKSASLAPGQTATAEVIVRQRRVIDFVLEPFRKLQNGGLNL